MRDLKAVKVRSFENVDAVEAMKSFNYSFNITSSSHDPVKKQ